MGIGAGITAVAIISVFSLLSLSGEEKELILEQAKTPDQEPQKIELSVFTDNGSPYLGDPSAPIILVEFGDYQCFFCNKYFHSSVNFRSNLVFCVLNQNK